MEGQENGGALQQVLDALMELRSPFAMYENDIHQWVAARLNDAGLAYCHEAVIGAGCRIDFLADGVGIEIKKGKPKPGALTAQLERYAACDGVQSLIVLTQRSVRLPKAVLGKPLRQITLSQLWGVALP